MPTARCSLFVYGTLMDDARVEALAGRRLRRSPAVLVGYRKVVDGTPYPFIRPDPNGTVEGCVLHEVDGDALRAFDEYEDEGRLYRRVAVTVSVGGTPEQAMTYVGIAEVLAPAELNEKPGTGNRK